MMLSRGARGDAVENLQTLLVEAGLYQGDFDGIYGAKTEAAVRRFQGKLGLETDGLWGPVSTAKAMELLTTVNPSTATGPPVVPTLAQPGATP